MPAPTTKQEIEDDPKWPYVRGFQTQPIEHKPQTGKTFECKIEGKPLPSWLHGVLYRVGPGRYEVYNQTTLEKVLAFNHWFDGLTLLHRFQLTTDGRILYNSRYTATKQQEKIENGTEKTPTTFGGVDVCQSIFGKVLGTFRQIATRAVYGDPKSEELSVNVGVTVTPAFFDGRSEQKRLVLKTDGNFLQPVDEKSLAPEAMFTYTDINPDFTGFLSAAHEEYDAETESLFNFTIQPGMQTTASVFEISPIHPKGRLLDRIQLDGVPYIHSMASTKKYIILTHYPVELDWGGMKLLYEGCFTKAFSWLPEKKTKFYVLDRASGKHLGTYEHEAFFVFHSINAFDDNEDDIVMDLSCYPDASIMFAFTLENLRNAGTDPSKKPTELPKPTVQRFRLANIGESLRENSANSLALRELNFTNSNLEMPQLNPTFKYRSDYKYVYGIAALHQQQHQHQFADSIIKLDMRTGAYIEWHEAGCTPGEPMFVVDPTDLDNSDNEDAGVLLSVILDGKRNSSFLLILDARTLRELSRAQVPSVIPFGFHGAFVQ